MSALCQKQTRAVQQNFSYSITLPARLRIVGEMEKTDCLRSFKINDEFKFGGPSV